MDIITFKNLLFRRTALEISLSHRIAVGKGVGPPPIVYCLDWNPIPSVCKGRNDSAFAVLACLSSYGTHIYYCPKRAKKWTTMVITNRPSRKGPSLKWHANGKFLASTSDPSSSKPANLSVLSYNRNLKQFDSKRVHEFTGLENRISSVIWMADDMLIAAIYPSSKISFFQFDQNTCSVRKLGSRICNGFPQESPIILQSAGSHYAFFACSEKADTILVWGKELPDEEDVEPDVGWVIQQIVKTGTGLISMAFCESPAGLVAIEKGRWKFWEFLEYNYKLSDLKFESHKEHEILKGSRRKSTLISAAVSESGNYLASGGTGDTFIFYRRARKNEHSPIPWIPQGSRNGNFCFGEVRCITFNPKNHTLTRVATGGDTGFIHIWAAFYMTSNSVRLENPERSKEHLYYDKYISLDSANVPSTSTDEDAEQDSEEDPDWDAEQESESDSDDYWDDELNEEEYWNDEQNSESNMQNIEREVYQISDSDEDEVVVVEGDEEVVVEYDEREDEDEDEAEAEVMETSRQGAEQLQDVEVENISEGGAGLTQKFHDITELANDILERIQVDGAAPIDVVTSLCSKILQSKDDINSLMKI